MCLWTTPSSGGCRVWFAATARRQPHHRQAFEHWGAEQLVADALRHQLDFSPAPADHSRPDWNYSNSGYVLAGMIIEKVTGRPWAEDVRDRIIRPLGLTGTYALVTART